MPKKDKKKLQQAQLFQQKERSGSVTSKTSEKSIASESSNEVTVLSISPKQTINKKFISEHTGSIPQSPTAIIHPQPSETQKELENSKGRNRNSFNSCSSISQVQETPPIARIKSEWNSPVLKAVKIIKNPASKTHSTSSSQSSHSLHSTHSASSAKMAENEPQTGAKVEEEKSPPKDEDRESLNMSECDDECSLFEVDDVQTGEEQASINVC